MSVQSLEKSTYRSPSVVPACNRSGLFAIPEQTIERPCPATGDEEEKQTHRHRKIGPRIAYHEPKALIGVRQLGHFGCHNRSQDYDQERYAREPGKQADKDQKTTGDLESSDKMCCKTGVWEADLRKSQHTHMRVDVLQNSLGEENRTDRQPNK